MRVWWVGMREQLRLPVLVLLVGLRAPDAARAAARMAFPKLQSFGRPGRVEGWQQVHIKNFEGRIRHEPVVRPQMTVTDPRMTLEPPMTMSRHNRSILGATAGTSNFNDRDRSADEGSYFSSMRLPLV